MSKRAIISSAVFTTIGLVMYMVIAFFLGSSSFQYPKSMAPETCSDRYVTPEGTHRCESHVEISLVPEQVITDSGPALVVSQATKPHGKYGATFHLLRNDVAGFMTESIEPYLKITVSELTTSNSSTNSHPYNYGAYISTSSYSDRVELQPTRSKWFYPFDTYQGNLQLLAITQKSPTDPSNISGVPVVVTADPGKVGGWNISMQRQGFIDGMIENRPSSNKGLADVSFQATRSSSSVFVILALLAICLVAGIGGFMVLFAIMQRRRPPTINALAWFATSLFAMLQIRANLPDGPPIGSLIDFIVIFPMIVITLVAIVLATSHWIRREDWELRRAVSKNIPEISNIETS